MMSSQNKIIHIDTIDIPELEIFKDLNEPQLAHYFEPNGGLFIAESSKVIERALDAGYEPYMMLLDERIIDGKAADIIARVVDIPIFAGSSDILMKIGGYQMTQGMLCAMHRKKPEKADICKTLESADRVVVLDNIENPTNVGAIVRSAVALGMDAILVTNDSSDPLYRRAIRVGMGNIFLIPWYYVDDNYSELLHGKGYKTAAMALREDSVRLDYLPLVSEKKLAIIMGNEGDGLKDDVIAKCDYTVKIPMYYGADSLNVAAASAVAFWELGKRNVMADTYKD